MKAEIFTEFDQLHAIRNQWNALIQHQPADGSGLDVTSRFEWLEAVWAVNANDHHLSVVVISDARGIAAIFPLALSVSGGLGRRRRTLQCVSAFYGGRFGFLLREPDPALFNTLFDTLRHQHIRWDQLQFTLMDAGPAHRALAPIAKQWGNRLHRYATHRSPIIELPDTWETLLGRLKKKARYTIRKGEERLSGLGELRVVNTQSADQAEQLLQAMMFVEQRSWKQDAGSSITRIAKQQHFYERFLPRAAELGWLQSYVLYLNDEAIAYLCGLRYEGIFYDLKESYIDAMKQYSPGEVLKRYAFTDLIDQGIRHYDFMGACEKYKLKWQPRIYQQSSYVIYNHSPMGGVLQMLERLRRQSHTS